MVEKYGIEGLLVVNETLLDEESKRERFSIETRPEKDEAKVFSGKKVFIIKTFDRVQV